jgi:dihydropteroate synthase
MHNLKVEDTYFPTNSTIRIGHKLIDLTTPIVMGILNIKPDSFYVNSRLKSDKEILERVEQMLIDGAKIIDIGGYSSRPGAEDISIKEEMNRVQPIVSLIARRFPDCILSLDTFRGEVARTGIENGAHIINDISGFELDPSLLDVLRQYRVPYILMHMKGTPQTMVHESTYENIFCEMMRYFTSKIKRLQDEGINDIIIDPGFGFSKKMEQSHFLLEHLDSFHFLNKPLLVGISRKSLVYKKLGVTPEEALPGTIALNALALRKGASILRVHDVKEAVQLIKLTS